jgi:hypothetical protein
MRDTENFSQTIHYVQFADPISSVNRTPVGTCLKTEPARSPFSSGHFVRHGHYKPRSPMGCAFKTYERGAKLIVLKYAKTDENRPFLHTPAPSSF